MNRIDPFGLIAPMAAAVGAGSGAASSGLGVGASYYSQSSEGNQQIANALWKLVNPTPALDAAAYYLYRGGFGESLYDLWHENREKKRKREKKAKNRKDTGTIADSTTPNNVDFGNTPEACRLMYEMLKEGCKKRACRNEGNYTWCMAKATLAFYWCLRSCMP